MVSFSQAGWVGMMMGVPLGARSLAARAVGHHCANAGTRHVIAIRWAPAPGPHAQFSIGVL